MSIVLAIHGGAWNIPDTLVEPSRDGIRVALQAGWLKLQESGSALDAVETAVRVLEDNPIFDAGRGSRLNSDGLVEMDASIMDGDGLRGGAVAAIRDVLHPISVARSVMEHSEHVLIVGSGARRFAEASGAELCSAEDLQVGREHDRHRRVKRGEREWVDQEFDPEAKHLDGPMGTVGAVALDEQGRVAAATSTGGTQNKAPGRVGDTPILGAGTYADNRYGAASATGWGEGILRVLLTKSAVDELAAGRAPSEAGARALAGLAAIRGTGGLILIDDQGRVAMPFNSPRMARGVADIHSGLRVAVDPGECA